jgi:hypothetical protein
MKQKNAYKVLEGKHEGKIPRGEAAVDGGLETNREGVDWIYLAQDRDKCLVHLYKVMKLRFVKY